MRGENSGSRRELIEERESENWGVLFFSQDGGRGTQCYRTKKTAGGDARKSQSQISP